MFSGQASGCLGGRGGGGGGKVDCVWKLLFNCLDDVALEVSMCSIERV